MLINDFKILEKIVSPRKMSNLYHFGGVSGFSIDSRTIKKGQAFIALRGKCCDGHDFIEQAASRGACAIISQKDLSLKRRVPFFLAEDTMSCLSRVIIYLRERSKAFIYAVTGSVGKTTTKEMLSWLLSQQEPVLKNEKTENNLLGLAKTIFRLGKEKTAVLELGTSAKGEIRNLSTLCKPDVGIITFIKPVHLDGLDDLRGVYQEKISLIESNPRMKLILNCDDPYLCGFNKRRQIFWFGKAKDNDLYYSLKERKNNQSLFLIQDKYEFILATHQEAFISNVMAALLAARLKGSSYEELISRMRGFKDFPNMRMQMRKTGNFFILNDSYNANPYSFSRALDVLANYSLSKIAVIGDMLELGKKSRYYHELLAGQVVKTGLKYCLTFGEDSLYLHEKLLSCGYKGAYHFSSHQDIADFITGKAKGKKEYLIFLKGSRALGLEKVEELLVNNTNK